MRTSFARLTLPLTALTTVIAVGFGCAPQKEGRQETPMVNTSAVAAAIDSLTGAFTAAVAARDTNAVVNFYADDARVLPPNAPRADGKDAVRQVWVGFLSTPGLELSVQTGNVIVSEAGDMAVDVGSYSMRGQAPDGKPFDDAGKYVTVFKKTDGGWKIVVDVWNSDRPVPGAGG